MLLGYCVASVDPVEVDVYGLSEVYGYELVFYAILKPRWSVLSDIQLADIW